MIEPTWADIGRKVIYRDHSGPDEGSITSFNSTYVFVKYSPGVKATRREDLEWSDVNRAAHPEIHADEIWIGNIYRGDFVKIGWETKRLGTTAYLADGRPIPKSQGFGPVFVGRKEIEGARLLPPSPTPGTIDHRWIVPVRSALVR